MSLKRLLSRPQLIRQTSRRGTVAILAAISLVGALAFVAFAVDFGHIELAENQLQNAADSAALSGARKLPFGREDAIEAAKKWATVNAIAGDGLQLEEGDVELGYWDQDLALFTAVHPNSEDTINAVRVTAHRTKERGNPLNLFIAPVLGTDYANLEVSAVATLTDNACGGIMALEKIYLNDRQAGRASYTDSYDSNQGDYTVPRDNGDICTNGHLTLNGNSYVNGDARWWREAKDPKAVESQVSGIFGPFDDPIEFPPVDTGGAEWENDNDTIPFTFKGLDPLQADGSFRLGYPASNNNGKKKKKKNNPPDPDGGEADFVTLDPGVYYFTSMGIGSYSELRITGPTYIYVDGEIDLRYGSIVNETRKPINLQIYPIGVETYMYLPFFGELHASIYSTTAHIYLDEKDAPVNLEFYGKMVGQAIRVWDTALHVDESIAFESLTSGGAQIGKKSGARLVQ